MFKNTLSDKNTYLAHLAKQVQKLAGAENVRIKAVIDPSLVQVDWYGRPEAVGGEIAAQLDLGDVQLAVRYEEDFCFSFFVFVFIIWLKFVKHFII